MCGYIFFKLGGSLSINPYKITYRKNKYIPNNETYPLPEASHIQNNKFQQVVYEIQSDKKLVHIIQYYIYNY